jgi:uncharacterized damage-inducible protein DinB
MLDQIRALYAYNAWANDRILDTAARLDREQFLADEDGVGSIRDTLVHTAAAQAVWLERWRGGPPLQLWDAEAFPDVATLRQRWADVERATAEYLAALTPPKLGRDVSYLNFRGETWSYPLWQQLIHQVNHATQHRSEAALFLTRHGHSPGNLDFLIYFDEQGTAADR